MTNLTVISSAEINAIKFAIEKIEEIRDNINFENQENKSKDDLVMLIIDIEEVLTMVNEHLEKVIEIAE